MGTLQKKLLKIVINTFLLLAFWMAAPATAKVKVYYAGFSYLGDCKNIKTNYPYSSTLNKFECGQTISEQPYLDKILIERIKSHNFQNFNLRIGEQATDTKGSAIALAFALDRETTSVEQIGNKYKVITELSAQALFFDQQEKTLINSYPVVVQYIDVLDEYPIDTYFRGAVDQLYTGSGEVNVFNELINQLKAINLDRENAARIQVTQVNLEEKALTALPDRFISDQDNFRKYIASTFTGYLSKNQNVPMLPYSAGHAIGNKMAFTVATGEVFDLKVPEPDYEVRLTVRGFKKALIEKTPVETAWAYGAYMKIEVIEPVSKTSYIDTQFVNAATKTVPESQKNVDDWAAYLETLIGLFDSLTREVSNPTRKWVKEHSPEKGARKALKRFNEVLKQCA